MAGLTKWVDYAYLLMDHEGDELKIIPPEPEPDIVDGDIDEPDIGKPDADDPLTDNDSGHEDKPPNGQPVEENSNPWTDGMQPVGTSQHGTAADDLPNDTKSTPSDDKPSSGNDNAPSDTKSTPSDDKPSSGNDNAPSDTKSTPSDDKPSSGNDNAPSDTKSTPSDDKPSSGNDNAPSYTKSSLWTDGMQPTGTSSYDGKPDDKPPPGSVHPPKNDKPLKSIFAYGKKSSNQR